MKTSSNIRGRALPLGDNVSTDVLHPPEFFSLDPDTVKRGVLAKYDPSVAAWIRPGDILIAGRNFGCGSSREAVVRCLVLCGIGTIVAHSFARIFFRTCINLGIVCLTLRDHVAFVPALERGEMLTIELENWSLSRQHGITHALEPLPVFVQALWRQGGILQRLA
ncbi:aconitate hydratase [Myxococcota bacterium]